MTRTRWLRGHHARRDAFERFMDLIEEDPETGCWVWIGSLSNKGYGCFRLGNKNVLAHRFAYQTFVGPIPDGLVLDHFKCDRPACANPEHVRPVTDRENTLRSNSASALNLAKTHCPRGHAYDIVNTYATRRGSRACRQCTRDQQREYMRRKRAGQPRRQGVFCRNGHRLVEGSWVINSSGHRMCRECLQAKGRRSQQRYAERQRKLQAATN